MSTKFCPRCQKAYPLENFQRNASRKDGLSGWCKLCARAATAAWKKANPELANLHSRLQYYNRKLAKQEEDLT